LVAIHRSMRAFTSYETAGNSVVQVVEGAENHIGFCNLEDPALDYLRLEITTPIRQAVGERSTQHAAGARVRELQPSLLADSLRQDYQPRCPRWSVWMLASCSAAATTLAIGCLRSSATR
jgi:hypothetical protein